MGGVERLAEFVERTCHGPSGGLWRGAGYMPASPNSLTHGRDLAQATGRPAERGGHTTWTCRTCGQTVYGPPLNTHCTTLDGPATVRLSNQRYPQRDYEHSP